MVMMVPDEDSSGTISGVIPVGIACCTLIALFVRDEVTFDRYHAHADRVYRVLRTPPGAAQFLASAFDRTEIAYDPESRVASVTGPVPADSATAAMLPVAATNVWTLELDSGASFSYALRREGTERRFRADFDLTRPVAPPPPPWGAR